jgi:peptidyl-prolyl cis-trans isomerase B (cyclophilin B)
MLRLIFVIVLMLGITTDVVAQRKGKPRPKQPVPAAQPENPPEPQRPPEPPPEPEPIRPPATPLSVEQMQKMLAVIETSMGDITIEFYPQAAPNHVRQFIWLAESGYFNGMAISRIIPKFIIQSGNPASWEESNTNQKKRFDIPKLKAEYDPNIKHDRGAVSMARPNDEPDGGTSHFFICALKASSLDNQYSVFGRVVNGLDVVDNIAASAIAEGTQDKPRDRIEIKRVAIKEKEAETVKP